MCADRTGPEVQGRPVALVTGAGRRAGIATATALHLAQAGWDVAFTHFAPYGRPDDLGRGRWGHRGTGCPVAGGGSARALDRSGLPGRRDSGAGVRSGSHRLGPVTGLVLGHCESVFSRRRMDQRTTPAQRRWPVAPHLCHIRARTDGKPRSFVVTHGIPNRRLTWEPAGSSTARNDLLSSRSQVRILPGAQTKTPAITASSGLANTPP